MILTCGWLCLGLRIYFVSVQAAHLPTDTDNRDGEEIQTYVDVEDISGQTHKNPLGVYQELLTNQINKVESEDSGLVPEADSGGILNENIFLSKRNYQKDQSSDSSGLVFNPAFRGPSVPTSSSNDRDFQSTDNRVSSSHNQRLGDSGEYLVTYGNFQDDTANNRLRVATGRDYLYQQQQAGDQASKQELVLLFANSGKGSSALAPGCSLLHYSVKSRCSANVMELTVSSRVPVTGQLTLAEGDGEVAMDGPYMVLYAVLDTQSTITDARWRLVPELLKKDINKDCIICDVLSVRLVLKVGESTCGMEVFCQQKGGTNKIPTWGAPGAERAHGSLGTIPTNSVTSGPVSPHDPTSTAKTTISILRGLDMNGIPLTGEVGLGTKLVLVVSAYCKDVTLDLHLIKCQAKGEDGISIAIVKDGCSVAQVMGEFREVLGVVHESSFGATPVRRVTQYARLDAFNTRTTQQNISIVCTIKMCSGECVEQPSCVQSDINLGKSKRPTVSLFSQVVSLGKAFQAAGLSATPSEDKLSKNEQGVQSLGAGDAVDDLIGDCISYHTLYILICLLTGIHLAILGWCIYCVRRTTTRTVVQSCMEDYESPKRALYTEYSSPRKRTPKSSPEYSSFSISTEAYNSPNYKRM